MSEILLSLPTPITFSVSDFCSKLAQQVKCSGKCLLHKSYTFLAPSNAVVRRNSLRYLGFLKADEILDILVLTRGQLGRLLLQVQSAFLKCEEMRDLPKSRAFGFFTHQRASLNFASFSSLPAACLPAENVLRPFYSRARRAQRVFGQSRVLTHLLQWQQIN